MKVSKFAGCVFVFAMSMALLAFANDMSALRVAVQNSPFLLEGNVDVIKVGEKRYLVSVGVVSISPGSPASKVSATRRARMVAEESLMKFIYPNEVTVHEDLTVKTRTVNDEKMASLHRMRSEELTMLIRDRSRGALPPLVEVDTWESANGQERLTILALPIPQQQ